MFQDFANCKGWGGAGANKVSGYRRPQSLYQQVLRSISLSDAAIRTQNRASCSFGAEPSQLRD